MPERTRPPSQAVGPIIARVAVFSLLGAPLAAYLWHTLNLLMAGHFTEVRPLPALAALVLFLLLIFYLSRLVVRWEGERRT
jgi:hypothetical protein